MNYELIFLLFFIKPLLNQAVAEAPGGPVGFHEVNGDVGEAAVFLT